MKITLRNSLFLGIAFGATALSTSIQAQGKYTYPEPPSWASAAPVYQDNRTNPSRVSDMVSQLRGRQSANQARSNYVDRSITINPSARPKGCPVCTSNSQQLTTSSYNYPSPYNNNSQYGYQQTVPTSGNFSYQVDQSAQICTNQIKFLKNSTQLADHCSVLYLQSLARALMDPALRHNRFVIEGHASAEGSYSSNQSLSQRRANAIFDFLVRQGVNPARLLSVGHGEAQARYPSRSAEYLRAEDRRVMVFKLAS